jgi:hypothetical protein
MTYISKDRMIEAVRASDLKPGQWIHYQQTFNTCSVCAVGAILRAAGFTTWREMENVMTGRRDYYSVCSTYNHDEHTPFLIRLSAYYEEHHKEADIKPMLIGFIEDHIDEGLDL